MTELHHTLKTFWAGEVVCNTGQVPAEVERELNKLVRKGVAVKWRGYWFPVAGASYGIGPLKTCWGLAEKFAPELAA